MCMCVWLCFWSQVDIFLSIGIRADRTEIGLDVMWDFIRPYVLRETMNQNATKIFLKYFPGHVYLKKKGHVGHSSCYRPGQDLHSLSDLSTMLRP